jgi:hypothetical protein
MPRKKASQEVKLAKDIKAFSKEVKQLTKEVRKLKDLEYLKVFKHPWKFMGFSLLKGLMVGFGSVLGASLLVALFIYILAQISFVPIIGDFVEDIMGHVETTNTTEGDTPENKDIFDQYNEAK